MGDLFYNSSITLAASDALNSSKGLFIPETYNTEYPWLGVIALPPSFGNNKGQAYVTAPSWGTSGSPLVSVHTGILQTRGWV